MLIKDLDRILYFVCFFFSPPQLFLFHLSGSFLRGDFSDGQTNNLVNTQTDTDRRPASKPPPHYMALGANREQGVSQRRVWGIGAGGVSLNSWDSLIVFLGPLRD